MNITIRVINRNPNQDLLETAYTCKGKVYDGKKLDFNGWVKWILAEHSPLESIFLSIRFEDIPKPIVNQLVRHTNGHPRHYVQSSRPDLTGKPRDPDQLITYECIYTPKALVEMARKRLCSTAEYNTRMLILSLKKSLLTSEFDLLKAIGHCMVPNCMYRGGCPEPWSKCELSSKTSIQERYAQYNLSVMSTVLDEEDSSSSDNRTENGSS